MSVGVFAHVWGCPLTSEASKPLELNSQEYYVKISADEYSDKKLQAHSIWSPILFSITRFISKQLG